MSDQDHQSSCSIRATSFRSSYGPPKRTPYGRGRKRPPFLPRRVAAAWRSPPHSAAVRLALWREGIARK